jgi:hypothetical protein
MARKLAPEKPLPAQKFYRHVLEKSDKKGRHKFLVSVPSNEVSNADVHRLITDSLTANAEVLGIDHQFAEGWADNWSAIIIRAVRYGVPTADFEAEGFVILEAEMGDPPMCQLCQENDA